MPILKPTTDTIAAASRIIREGGLVAMPTETVYGLAADATSTDAVLSIYTTKGRPRFNPLIVHVDETAMAWTLAEPTAAAEKLAAIFWPGPLTLVLKARPGNGISDIVTAGLGTIAIRTPAHDVARALVAASGRPLAAPSANRSGRISPTSAADVAADLGDDVMILDGGHCEHGLESTIVDLTGNRPALLRAGSIEPERIEAALGVRLARPSTNADREGEIDQPVAPGQLASHYAPRAGVRLNASHVSPGEALLAFGPDPLPTAGPVENLSPTADLKEAAKALFAAMRRLDATGAATIAVMRIPETGLGEAIVDRLSRAAAPRY